MLIHESGEEVKEGDIILFRDIHGKILLEEVQFGLHSVIGDCYYINVYGFYIDSMKHLGGFVFRKYLKNVIIKGSKLFKRAEE